MYVYVYDGETNLLPLFLCPQRIEWYQPTMEYVRDAKLSTLELVRNLVFRGKKVLGNEGLNVDAIRSKRIVADTVCARKLVLDETPAFSDTSMRWLKRGQGDLCTTVGTGSFAASGAHVHVSGDRSCVLHGMHTNVGGNENVVVGGSKNHVSGHENTVIGAHDATLSGSRCTFLGGKTPVECSCDDIVLVRTADASTSRVNHQQGRVLLLGTNGVCSSVHPTVVGNVHTVQVRAGTTIPENTMHWSIDTSSSETGDETPSLIVSYKNGSGSVYEGRVPLRLVDDS